MRIFKPYRKFARRIGFHDRLKCGDHPESAIDKLVFDNPLAFWRMSNRWQEWPEEETEPKKKKEKARV